MKALIAAVALLIPTVSLGAQALAAPRTEEAVISADNSWGQAEQDGDSKFVEHLLLDGYKSIGSTGKVTTKAQIVDGTRKRGRSAEYAKKVAEWKSKHPSQAEVTLFGDTAVLTWVRTGTGSTMPVYSSDIFVYREGEWRAAYSQHSTAEITP